ncbi:MAG: DUF3866 family protein [Coriobacteriia bacterium]|nr:DUF3866 family protein [Coriobacteriia bacterium]
MRLVWGIVTKVVVDEEQVQHLEVALDDRSTGRAVAFPPLSGRCVLSDRVLLNTTAVDLALGTGGLHFVVTRGPAEGVVLDQPAGGHIMKLRYTPMQLDVASVEEQGAPDHETMKSAESLGSLPVACCGLHSQVPLVAAAIKNADPNLKVVYVMSDQAALPLALSDVVRTGKQVGLLDATVTCGQSFGGDIEAVNLHSGLLAACHVLKADVVIVAIGPGVVGTATPFGHGGVAQGEAINAVSVLGGVPVAVLRVSFADARSRHHGVSHHTISALTRIALARALVALPSLPEEYEDVIEEALDLAGVWALHRRISTSAGRTSPPSTRGIEVRTMGRSIAEDPAFFAAAFAAGEVCVRAAHGEHFEPEAG